MRKLICLLLAVLLLTACGTEPVAQTTESTADPNAPLTAQVGDRVIRYAPWEQEGIPASGDYFLTRDVVLTAPVTVSGNLNLHLNGHSVTADGDAMPGNLFRIPAGAAMTVYEEEGGMGAIVSPRSYTAKMCVSSMFLVEGELTLAGGSIDGSAINLEDRADGLCVHIRKGGVLHMLGGSITGGTTWRNQLPEDGSEPFGNGGAIYVAVGGTCNISGGQIHSGSAARGGNIFVAGNEDECGILNMTGGTVRDGEATAEGGNIAVYGAATVNSSTVSGGTSYAHGGNIYLKGTLELRDSLVADGQSNSTKMLQYMNGGNILVNGKYARLHVENSKILDGNTNGKENYGGNVCVTELGAEYLQIVNSELSGGRGHRGGNFYVGHLAENVPEENLDYVITGTLISGGSCTYRGANICVDTKNADRRIGLTLNDCQLLLSEGDSQTNLSVGAGASDNTRCDVTFNGGKMENGSLVIYGNGVVTMNGTQWENTGYGGGGTLNINE